MPLFSFVWEYNNQPIGVLAQDIVALSVNTGKFIPVSTGYSFIDSPLKAGGTGSTLRLWGNFNGQDDGISLYPGSGKYYFGAYEVGSGVGNRTYLEVDDAGGNFSFFASGPGPNPVRFGVDSINSCMTATGLDSNTAGTAAGKYLTVRVNNIPYKIALLNN